MYDVSSLQAGLIGLIGWRQNHDPSGVQLSGLTDSSSGLYYNDEHPLLSIENLLSIAPEFTKLSTPAAWNSGTDYIIGDLVSLSGTNYIATAASTNQTPPNTDYWEVYDAFTYWLKQKTEAGIIRAIQSWAEKKVQRRTANNLIERNLLFDTAVRRENLDTNNGRMVGIEIVPTRSRGLVYEIERIGLQFDTNQTITVYLFHSETTAPVQSQAVVYAASGGMQWAAVNWELEPSGAYYLVYDQSAISGQSINGVFDYVSEWENLLRFPTGKLYRATAIDVTDSSSSVLALWDIDQMGYTLGTNWGLNLDINSRCDYTELILEQKDLFAGLISKVVTAGLLRELAFNPTSRVNRHEANVDRTTLLYEIDGDSQGRPGGIRKQIEDAIEAIQLDTTGIDEHCLPCRRRGVKYRAV